MRNNTWKMRLPVIWPITRTRYRLLLEKMYRQWNEIQCLVLENEELKQQIERLSK